MPRRIKIYRCIKAGFDFVNILVIFHMGGTSFVMYCILCGILWNLSHCSIRLCYFGKMLHCITVKNYVRNENWENDPTEEVRVRGEPPSKRLWEGTSVCMYVSCVCLRVGNWMTARLSLQLHFTALEWHCRWMSLKCFSKHANSRAQTDAECRYKLWLLFA